jgi:hypothetical protein
MDADQIRQLRPELRRYLRHFADCFCDLRSRAHLPVYVRGQLSDLPHKSVEPMALAEGMPPRTLQEFLSLLEWDECRMVDRLQWLVARDHASSHGVGIIDETGCPKKGDQTPGAQRQYCIAMPDRKHWARKGRAVGQSIDSNSPIFCTTSRPVIDHPFYVGICAPSRSARAITNQRETPERRLGEYRARRSAVQPKKMLVLWATIRFGSARPSPSVHKSS